MSLARLVHEKAHAEAARMTEDGESAGPGALPALIAAFDRVSRSVRRTAGLARRLDDEAVGVEDGRRVAARRRIIRVLEDAIERQAPNAAAEARLHEELVERLDGPDLDDDVGVRPVDDIIEELCRDLGLRDIPRGVFVQAADAGRRCGAVCTGGTAAGCARSAEGRGGSAEPRRVGGCGGLIGGLRAWRGGVPKRTPTLRGVSSWVAGMRGWAPPPPCFCAVPLPRDVAGEECRMETACSVSGA